MSLNSSIFFVTERTSCWFFSDEWETSVIASVIQWTSSWIEFILAVILPVATESICICFPTCSAPESISSESDFTLFVDSEIDVKTYVEFAEIALTKQGSLFQYINHSKIDDRQYTELAYLVLKNNINYIEVVLDMLKSRLTTIEITKLLERLKQEKIENNDERKYKLINI